MSRIPTAATRKRVSCIAFVTLPAKTRRGQVG